MTANKYKINHTNYLSNKILWVCT